MRACVAKNILRHINTIKPPLSVIVYLDICPWTLIIPVPNITTHIFPFSEQIKCLWTNIGAIIYNNNLPVISIDNHKNVNAIKE